MKILLDDSVSKKHLYPFAVTRHVATIRVGILTIREKWEMILGKPVFLVPGKDINTVLAEEALLMSANIIPTKKWVASFLAGGTKLVFPGDDTVKIIEHPWEIFQYNDWAIRQDFNLLCSGRRSQPLSSTNTIIAPGNIFLEEGATVEHCTLNASTGPIYIGKNAIMMEGCLIRGPLAMCEGAVLKMGSKVYGATTIGPYCNAAGEIKNSVLAGYSNKAHDGYLGDSVIGEWCNIGAGSSNSNVKNSAGMVSVWDQSAAAFVSVGPKCGLLMGDYSRAAINTSFNTGTMIGICCNIFGEGFPPKFVPDFTWGKERYNFNKVIKDISNWKKLKGKPLTEEEQEVLHDIYHQKK